VFVTEGDIPEPTPLTNVVNEVKEGRRARLLGKPLPPKLRETSQK